MNHLRYKDYQGSVTFVDGTLLIQILHIDDLITTECENASAAQAAFEELVDDYIKTCAEQNKSPSKPFKGSFNVRVSPTLHRSIAMLAADSGESLNSYVEKALEEKVERSSSSSRYFATNYLRVLDHDLTQSWSYITFGTRAEENPVLGASARVLYDMPVRGLRN